MSLPPAALRAEAPAKINLYLHVVGRRADGFHLLDSLVAFAGIGDTLELATATELTLEVGGPRAAALADEADNLVLKAARLLADWAEVPPAAALRLVKRLPVASGIGGGSADAAAALRGLAELWKLDPGEALADLALQLGADVPVCLAGRPTQVAGVGEVLRPAPPLPPAWLVLANPGAALATPAVFRARAESGAPFSDPLPLTVPPRDAGALAGELAKRRNDLTAAAISLVPEIAAVLAALEAAPGCLLARMSGSGATCFGLFAEPRSAGTAAAGLSAAHPAWWTAAAPLLDPRRPA